MQFTQPGLRMRPLFAAGMAFALCVAMAVRSTAADVGEWIPADALVVFKINNLQQVNQEAGALLREFGVAEQHPEAADPLGAFQNESGMREGLNLGGNLAIYLANGDLEGDTPPIVALIPVADYKAFLGNFKNIKDEGGGVSSFRPEEQGADAEEDNGDDDEDMDDADEEDVAYVMEMGEYAAISPMRDLLKKPEQKIELAGVTGEMLDERDVVIYANFQQLGPMLIQKMQEEGGREQAKQEMLEDLQENEQFARFAPVASAMVDQLFIYAERFLNEATAAAVSLNLDDNGVGFGSAAQFKPDSYFANLFSQMQAGDDSLLNGLPEGNYIFFGGSADNQAMNQKLFEDLLGPVIAELKQVEGGEKLAEYVDAIRAQVTAVGETRMGMFAPSGPVGGSALFQQVAIQGGNVEQLKQAQRRMVELQPEIMAEMMGGEMEGMGMNMQMQYEEGAKEVAGVSFDKLSTDMEGDQQQNPAAMPMRMLFGPEGPTSYLGEVEDKLVIVGGLSDQQITQVVEAVRGDDAPLADDRGVQMVLENLPDRRSAVFFVRPDELVKSGVGYSRQMGFNIPIEMPDNLPPMGFATGPAENAVRSDLFIPKDLISAMIVAGLQAQQQFEGMGQDDGF